MLVGWGGGVLAIITNECFECVFVNNLAVKSILCRRCAGLAPVRTVCKSREQIQDVIICVTLGQIYHM